MYVLILILISLHSCAEAVFTQKQNQLQGYDCSEPRGVLDRALNSDDLMCDTQHRHIAMEKNVTYQLLVRETNQRFKGWRCEIRDSRSVHYCGNYDHQTAYERLNYRKLPLHMDPMDCRLMVDRKEYQDPKGKKHTINKGGVTLVFYEEIGTTWATGTTPDSTSEIECQGGKWEIDGLHFTDMIVTHQLRITVVKEEYHAEDGQVTALTDGTRIPCGPSAGACQTAEATYLWKVPKETCEMAVSKVVTGVVATDEEGEQVFMSTDNSLVRLVFTQTESHCGRIIQATNYDNFYLAKLPHPMPFSRKLEASSISLSTYVNNRDDFLFNHMADILDAELGNVLRHNCRQRMKDRRKHYFLQHNIPGLVTYTLGNGTFATSAGEALYFYQCQPVLVRGVTAAHCYDALPVQLMVKDDDTNTIDDVTDFPTLFLEPLTRRLTTSAAQIPCSSTFRSKYQLQNYRWISADPHLRETVDPAALAAPDTMRIEIPRNIDWSKGGLYKQDELKKLETIIEMPRQREAMSWKILEPFHGGTLPGGPLRADQVFPHMASVDYYGGFIARFLSFLDRFGEGSAILVALYVIWKGINALIAWLYGGVHFFKAFGCDPKLLWSLCPTLWLLNNSVNKGKDDMEMNEGPIFRRKKKTAPSYAASYNTTGTVSTHMDDPECNPQQPLINPPSGYIYNDETTGYNNQRANNQSGTTTATVHPPPRPDPHQIAAAAAAAGARRQGSRTGSSTPPTARSSRLAPPYDPNEGNNASQQY